MDPAFTLLLHGVETKRFHTVATIRNETVGHHHGLVVGLMAIAYPSIRADVMRYAALHDLAEHVTGDPPSTVKRAHPEVKTAFDLLEESVYRQATIEMPILSRFEHVAFKRCDNVAGMMSCLREYMLGNTPILEQFRNFLSYYTLQREGVTQELTLLAMKDYWAPYLQGNLLLDKLVSDMDLSVGGNGYAEHWTPAVARKMEERRTGIRLL